MINNSPLCQKAGRKKLPTELKRKHPVTIYLNQEELEYLENAGKQFDLSAAKVIRLLLKQNNLLPQS